MVRHVEAVPSWTARRSRTTSARWRLHSRKSAPCAAPKRSRSSRTGTRVPFIPFPTPLRDSSAQDHRRHQHAGGYQRAAAGGNQQRLLLDELNHRTKNNMQMLQSLLFSAARTAHSEEARKVLERSQRADRGHGGGAACAVRPQRRQPVSRRKNSCRRSAKPSGNCCRRMRELSAALRTGVLSNDVAMPLALILNELLTNAVKHGVKDHARQGVRVSSDRSGRKFGALRRGRRGGLRPGRGTQNLIRTPAGTRSRASAARNAFRHENPSRACLYFPAAKI